MPATTADRWKEFEAIGIEVVRHLATVGLAFYGRSLRTERKADKSLVSEADRSIEAECRKLLATHTPTLGFVGEEFGDLARLDGTTGTLNLHTDTYWMLDPIDGTINFLSRSPLWSTLLALIHKGEPVLGIVSLPALDELFVASCGNGARHGKLFSETPSIRCAVRPACELPVAHFSTTSPTSFAFRGADGWFLELLARPGETRTHSDAYGFTRILCGGIDAMVDPIVAHYDVAALQVLFDETPDAHFTTLHGDTGPFRYRCGSAVAGNSQALTQDILNSYRKYLHSKNSVAHLMTPATRHQFIENFRATPEVVPYTKLQPLSQLWIGALEQAIADWRVAYPESPCAPFVRLHFDCRSSHLVKITNGDIEQQDNLSELCHVSVEVFGKNAQQSWQATLGDREHPEEFLHAALASVGNIDSQNSTAETRLLEVVSGSFPLPHAWPYGATVDASGMSHAAQTCAARQIKSGGNWLTTIHLETSDTFEFTRIAGQECGTKVRLHWEVLREDLSLPGLRVTRSIEAGKLQAAWAEMLESQNHFMQQLKDLETP